MSHENQSISLMGTLTDQTGIKLSFKDVDLNQITPLNNKLIAKGNINGEVNFKQNNAVYQPTASIVIDNLNKQNRFRNFEF
jgi:hypothetical protein